MHGFIDRFMGQTQVKLKENKETRMKKMLIVVAILVVSLAFFQTPVMAKTVKGMVLDVEVSSIVVAPDAEEGSTEVPEDVTLAVSPETKYTGVTSADELMIGDEVVVEA